MHTHTHTHTHTESALYVVIDLYLMFYSWPAMCIHGDKHQSEREWVLGGKKSHTLTLVKFITYLSTFVTLVYLCFCF